MTGCVQPGLIAGKKREDAAEEEGSGSLSVLTLGNHISCPPQLETPTGPTLEKQPHSALHTSLQRTPSCAGELLGAGAGKRCPGHTAGMGTLVSCFPADGFSAHSAWPACPRGAQRERNGACCHLETREHALLCNFPGDPGVSGPILTVSHPWPVPGALLRGLQAPRTHILYIHTCVGLSHARVE